MPCHLITLSIRSSLGALYITNQEVSNYITNRLQIGTTLFHHIVTLHYITSHITHHITSQLQPKIRQPASPLFTLHSSLSTQSPTSHLPFPSTHHTPSRQPTMYSIAPSPVPTLLSDPVTSTPPDPSAPSLFRYIIGFLLIGIAWGFTTPFIRAAARTHQPPSHPILASPSVTKSFVKSKLYGAFFGVVDLLRNPRYAIPLVINLTGSIWFFLLIGQAGEFFFAFFCRLLFFSFIFLVMSIRGGRSWREQSYEYHTSTVMTQLMLMICVELSLTVPITNSLAFLFTVLGEWWVERKVISRGNSPHSFSIHPSPRHRHH